LNASAVVAARAIGKSYTHMGIYRASREAEARSEAGIEHGSGLGTQRWVVERGFAHLHNFRRPRTRSERRPEIHMAWRSPARSSGGAASSHRERPSSPSTPPWSGRPREPHASPGGPRAPCPVVVAGQSNDSGWSRRVSDTCSHSIQDSCARRLLPMPGSPTSRKNAPARRRRHPDRRRTRPARARGRRTHCGACRPRLGRHREVQPGVPQPIRHTRTRQRRSPRREVRGQLVGSDLKEVLGATEVLQPMLTKICERAIQRRFVYDELARHPGDEHLSTAAGSADPRRAVHVKAHLIIDPESVC
jgi:hypothetical protein